jgi:hypothetical protein
MALYADNDYRWIVAVFSKADPGRQFNVAGHALLGLRDQVRALGLEDREAFCDYRTADEGLHARISRWPVIVLKTDRASLLRRLYLAARERGVPANAVLAEMIDTDHETQVANTARVTVDEARFLCVAVFEKNGQLKDLTRRFSLLR